MLTFGISKNIHEKNSVKDFKFDFAYLYALHLSGHSI